MPPCNCATMVSGLTAMPVSTARGHAAQTAPRRRSSTSTSHDRGDEAARTTSCAADAASARAPAAACPSRTFSATRSSAALRRGVLPSMLAAERDRILARLARQLVHEAFDGEHVVVRADAAPEAGRHRRRLRAHIFDAAGWGCRRACRRRCRPRRCRCRSVKAGGSQRAMIDEPVMRCFQPTILPSSTGSRR